MNPEEDSIYILGCRSSSPKPNGKRLHLSDSELAMNGSRSRRREVAYEESTLFSDSVYGDSLPSTRAQLAATRMLCRSKRELESSMNEDLPLLGNGWMEGGGGGNKHATIFEGSLKPADRVKKDVGANGKDGVGRAKVPRTSRRQEIMRL